MSQEMLVSMKLTADASQAKKELESLHQQLTKLNTSTYNNKNITGNFSTEVKKAVADVDKLRVALASASKETGGIDVLQLKKSMGALNLSVPQLGKSFSALGRDGINAFTNLTTSVMKAEIPLRKTSTLLTKARDTLLKTAQWQLSGNIFRSFTSAIRNAYSYVQDLDKSLNNIRIVSGLTADEMTEFAEKANEAARKLSVSTTAYTDAALIFYQQGLKGNQVTERAETVLKLSNVTGESAAEVSSYMTAIWNNFDDGSKTLEHYADVITALGAATASSSAEISQGLEKFAAIGNTVGLSYEYATTALATVVAQTRQSADTVGTAFKTLFARIQNLKLGNTLEDGTTLGKYSKALATIGVSIKDSSGQLKNMNDILDEMGSKWETLSKDTQVAVAQSVAGTRQYAQLVALLDNWDSFRENLTVANSSKGTLQEQADIYAESWEASRKRVKASLQEIYNNLIDEKFFIGLNDLFAKLAAGVGRLLDKMGGIQGVLLTLAPLLTKIFAKPMAKGLDNALYNIQTRLGLTTQKAIDFKKQFLAGYQQIVGELKNKGNLMSALSVDKLQTAMDIYLNSYENLNEEQQKLLQGLVDEVALRGKATQEAEAAAQESKKTEHDFTTYFETRINEDVKKIEEEQKTYGLRGDDKKEITNNIEKTKKKNERLERGKNNLIDNYNNQIAEEEKKKEPFESKIAKSEKEKEKLLDKKKNLELLKSNPVLLERYLNNEDNPNPYNISEEDINEIKTLKSDSTGKNKKAIKDILQKYIDEAEADVIKLNQEIFLNEEGLKPFEEKISSLKQKMSDEISKKDSEIEANKEKIRNTEEKNKLDEEKKKKENYTTKMSEYRQAKMSNTAAGVVLRAGSFLGDYQENDNIPSRDINTENFGKEETKAFHETITKLIEEAHNKLEEKDIKDNEDFGEKGLYKQLQETLQIILNNQDKLNEEGLSEEEREAITKELEEKEKDAKKLYNDIVKKATASAGEVTGDVSNARDALINAGAEAGQDVDAVKNYADSVDKVNEDVSEEFRGEVEQNSLIDQMKDALDSFAEKARTAGEVISGVSQIIGSVVGAIQQLKNLGNIWSDDDISTGEKILQTLTTLGFVIPSITSAFSADTLATIFNTKAKKKNSAANVENAITNEVDKKSTEGHSAATLKDTIITIKNNLVKKATNPIVLAVAAAVVVLTAAIASYIKEEQKEAVALENAQKNLEKYKEAASDAKSALEGFESDIQTYEELSQKIKDCVRGTQEWVEASEALNEQVLQLIQKYPQLDFYRSADGQLSLTNVDEVQNQLETSASAATMASVAGQAVVQQAQFNLDKKNLAKDIKSDVYWDGFGKYNLQGLFSASPVGAIINDVAYKPESFGEGLARNIGGIAGGIVTGNAIVKQDSEAAINKILENYSELADLDTDKWKEKLVDTELASEELAESLADNKDAFDKLYESSQQVTAQFQSVGEVLETRFSDTFSDSQKELGGNIGESYFSEIQQAVKTALTDRTTAATRGSTIESRNISIAGQEFNILDSLKDYFGKDVSITNVRGSDKNRKLELLVDGEKLTYTLDQLQVMLTSSLMNQESLLEEISRKLGDIPTELGGVFKGLGEDANKDNVIEAIQGLASGDKAALEELTKTDIEALNNLLESGEIKENDLAIAFGYEGEQDESYKNFLAAGNIEGTLVEEIQKSVNSYGDALKDFENNNNYSSDVNSRMANEAKADDRTLAEKKMLREVFQTAFSFGGGKDGLGTFEDILKEVNSAEQDKFIEFLANGSIVAGDTVSDVESKLESFGLSLDILTKDKIETLIDLFSGEYIPTLEEAASDYANVHSILDGKKVGDTISKDNYDKIKSLYGKEYFRASPDGTTYELIKELLVEDIQEKSNSKYDAILSDYEEKIKELKKFKSGGGIYSEDTKELLEQAKLTDQLGDITEEEYQRALQELALGYKVEDLTSESVKEQINKLQEKGKISKESIDSLIKKAEEGLKEAQSDYSMSIGGMDEWIENRHLGGDDYDSTVSHALVSEANRYSLDPKTVLKYTEGLKELGKEGKIASYNLNVLKGIAERVAISNSLLNTGLSEIGSLLNENYIVLKDNDRGTSTYRNTIDQLNKTFQKTFGISEDLSDSFFSNAKNMKLMNLAAKGDTDAVQELRKEIAKALGESYGLEQEYINQIDNVANQLGTTVIGASIQDLDSVNTLFNELVSSTKITTEQIKEIFEGMGWDIILTADNQINTLLSVYKGAAQFTVDQSKLNEKDKKEKKKFKDEIERYYTISNQLEDIEDHLTTIARLKDKAFGSDKIKYMNAELDKQAQKLEAQKEYLREINKYYDSDRAAMASYGAEFDANGTITNYTALMTKYISSYNAAVESFNENGDEKAFETAEKAYQTFTDALSKYTETQELLKDETEELESLKDEYSNLLLEKTKYKVEIRIDVDDNDLKYLESIFSRLEDNDFDFAKKLDIFDSETSAVLDKAIRYQDGLKEILSHHGAENLYSQLLTGNPDADAFRALGLTDEEISTIQEYVDALLEVNSAIDEQRDKYYELLNGAWDTYMEEMDNGISRISHFKTITENLNKIIDLSGKKLLKISNSTLSAMGQNVFQMEQNQFASSNAKLKALQEAREKTYADFVRIEKTGNAEAIEAMQEALDKMDQDIQSAEEEMLSSWSSTLESAKTAFENSIKGIVEDFEKSLSGVFDSFSELQSAYDKQKDINSEYVEDYEKIYQLSKLSRDITKSIDDGVTLKSQKALLEIQERITKLQESKTKLSEYDLENLRREYELKLAQAQLEDARANKNSMELIRDANGNWNYQYVADLNDVEDAEANYEDKLHAMQEANQEYIESLQEQILKVNSDMTAQIAALDVTEFESMDDYYNKVREITEYAQRKIDYFGSELNKVLDNNSILYEVDWTNYSLATGYKISADEEYTDKFAETVLAMQTGYSEWESYQQALNDAIGTWDNEDTLLGQLHSAYNQWYENLDSTFKLAGTSVEEYGLTVSDTVDSITKKTAEAREQVVTNADDMSSAIGKISNRIVTWESTLGAKTESIYSNITHIASGWSKVKDALSGINEQYATYGDNLGKYGDYTDILEGPEDGSSKNHSEEGTGNDNKIISAAKIGGNTGNWVVEYADGTSGIASNEEVGNAQKEYGVEIKTAVNGASWSSGATNMGGSATKPISVAKISGGNTEDWIVMYDDGSARIISNKDRLNFYNSLPVTSAINGASWNGSATNTGKPELITKIGGNTGKWFVRFSDKSVRVVSNEDRIKYYNNIPITNAMNGTSWDGGTFDTGGYTGEWGTQGKLAVLHEKEIVLNKVDTQNLLNTISILRDMETSVQQLGNVKELVSEVSKYSVQVNSSGEKHSEQVFNVTANFPNATSADEIRQAILNLPNYATQYVSRF